MFAAAATTTSRPFKRSHRACKSCSARKIRCTVTLSGPPCTNCTLDGFLCEVPRRKMRRNNDFIEPLPSLMSPQCNQSSPAGDVEKTNSQIPFEFREASGFEFIPDGDEEEPRSSAIQSFTSPQSSTTQIPDDTAYAEALNTSRPAGKAGALFYPGDKRGPAFVLDICEPTRADSNHIMVNPPQRKSLPDEDITFLNAKGCFQLPQPHVQNALIHCYFTYAHPFAPILDAREFIMQYESGTASLLLLWSVFLSAASFVDQNLLTHESFLSRRELKEAAYKRAKALYDVDFETDKVVLIQSTFLMGHWFTSTEDRTGPWHWNGIAISLSHTIGLHRLFVAANQRTMGIRPFLNRSWWCIYSREVWLSIGLGRPMRTNIHDVDTQLPTLGTSNMDDYSSQRIGRGRYLPNNIQVLLEIWCCFVKLTIMLSKIISKNYAVGEPTLSSEQIGVYQRQLENISTSLPKNQNRSGLTTLFFRQFALFYEATIIILYRPHIRHVPAGISKDDPSTWQVSAYQKARSAAANATAAINLILVEGLIGWCHTITYVFLAIEDDPPAAKSTSVIALVLPLQIHLFDSLSLNKLIREVGQQNFAVCMTAMNELRKTYVSGDAAYKLFEAAMAKVTEKQMGKPQASISGALPLWNGESMRDQCESYRNIGDQIWDTEYSLTQDYLFGTDLWT